jgi:hypothetical protein
MTRRYIKNMDTGAIFNWTETLAARRDMIETDVKGNRVVPQAAVEAPPAKPAKAPKAVKPVEPLKETVA